MSTNDSTTPVTPSFPNLLIRAASQRTNTTTRRRNSSIVSIPTSPMDTIGPPSPWPRRDSPPQGEDIDIVPQSPTLDHIPTNTFTRIRDQLQHPPPSYHLTVLPSSSPDPAYTYTNAMAHVQSPLIPLISVTTGESHPRFPTTLLQYHLLTHPDLDDLSVHFHQTEPPTEHSWRYPCRVAGWLPPPSLSSSEEQNSQLSNNLTLDTKRRRFGRFIGLRGCESPVEGGQREMERVEREWQRALERRREAERLREKSWRGAW